jgi:hypothetical protein
VKDKPDSGAPCRIGGRKSATTKKTQSTVAPNTSGAVEGGSDTTVLGGKKRKWVHRQAQTEDQESFHLCTARRGGTIDASQDCLCARPPRPVDLRACPTRKYSSIFKYIRVYSSIFKHIQVYSRYF